MGGEFTVENIQLRCRAHNGYEADLFYGAGPHDDGNDLAREAPAHYGAQLGPDRVHPQSAGGASAPS